MLEVVHAIMNRSICPAESHGYLFIRQPFSNHADQLYVPAAKVQTVLTTDVDIPDLTSRPRQSGRPP